MAFFQLCIDGAIVHLKVPSPAVLCTEWKQIVRLIDTEIVERDWQISLWGLELDDL